MTHAGDKSYGDIVPPSPRGPRLHTWRWVVPAALVGACASSIVTGSIEL